MRRTAYQTLVVAILATALAGTSLAFAAAVPARAASGAPAKVVIVVGPTGSATASYIDDATAAADAARRWTTDVEEIYTPAATWDRVAAALQGASIVVYMGHGNGFPDPRSRTYDGATQDGLGLDPPGGGNAASSAKYYGADLIAAQVRLAPSAVVILAHLCYAGGSSEPGMPDPTPAVARQRADGFAAGWMRAGARAVIADAWFGTAAGVIDRLFSTASTVEDIWRSVPGSNHSEAAAPSEQTPGATLTLDPAGSSFWRALTVFPGLAAADVVGGRAADTAATPVTVQVPGAAEVGPGGTQLFASNAAAPADGTPLAPGTRLRVLRSTGTPASGPLAGRPTVEVRPLDGGPTGRVPLDALIPRDSIAPIAYLIDGGARAIGASSGAGTGGVSISGRLSEPATWNAAIVGRDGRSVLSTGGSGDAFSVAWDGTAGGVPVADGSYDLRVSATDAWGNAGTALTFRIAVDRTPPVLTASLPATPVVVSPNGDGVADTLRTAFTASEAATLTVSVRDAAGSIVDTSDVPVPAGAGAVIWDGRGPVGAPIPDGSYTYAIVPRDAGGNLGRAVTRQVTVSTTLASVRTSAAVFDPATPGATRRDATLSFTLTRPATVTWTAVDAAGRTVRTFAAAQPMAAGPQSITWDGLSDAGAAVAPGTYTVTVRADDGATSPAQAVVVGVGPFRVAVSPVAPTRGKVVVITVWTALPLTAPPDVTVTQPGIGAWDAALTPLNATTWRLRTTIPTGGHAGRISLHVAGGVGATYDVALPLR